MNREFGFSVASYQCILIRMFCLFHPKTGLCKNLTRQFLQSTVMRMSCMFLGNLLSPLFVGKKATHRRWWLKILGASCGIWNEQRGSKNSNISYPHRMLLSFSLVERKDDLLERMLLCGSFLFLFLFSKFAGGASMKEFRNWLKKTLNEPMLF